MVKKKNEFTRRDFLKAGLGGMASLAFSQSYGIPVPPSRTIVKPNVIYILADQLRAASVGPYGNNEISTPNLDILAAESAVFNNAVSSSPLCTPYRAMLMTSRYPHQTGVIKNDIKLAPNENCIAESFKSARYHTYYVGKWHLDGPTENVFLDPGWVSPADRQGFRYWTGFNSGHIYYSGKYYQNNNPVAKNVPPGVYEPDFQTDKAIQFIESRAGSGRPFFTFLSLGPPHVSSTGQPDPPGGDYHFPYDPDTLTLRPNVDHPNASRIRQKYAEYYGQVSNLDYNVGRIMQKLEELNIADDTILVFSSDHGDTLGSHYQRVNGIRKKTVIESESLDVPFFLRYPRKVTPQVVEDVFGTNDIMPTLIGLSTLSAPNTIMGRDFSEYLVNGTDPIDPPHGAVPSTESTLVGMYGGKWLGLRTKEYSLMVNRSTMQPKSLYHNAVDPYQFTNVINHPDYQTVGSDLFDEFMAWIDFVGYPSNQN